MRIIRVLLLLMFLIVGTHSAFGADKQDGKKVPQGRATVLMEPAFSIDPSRTALLIMDYQNDIVRSIPEETRTPMLERASAVLKEARKAKIPVIYVTVRFRPGYPEVNPQNKLFSALKGSGRLAEGTPGAEIDAKVAPEPGDIIVTKRRVGAFSTTDLETILHSNNVTKLIMFGISTSGVVLSTVRWAADMDYSLAVVADLSADRDPEVHRVLTEKIFPWQATVVTSKELLRALHDAGTK